MKKMLVAVLGVVLVCWLAGPASAAYNHNGKFGLYLAGPEGSGTCAYVMGDCIGAVSHVNNGLAPGRWDLYLMAVDVSGIAGVRYGLTCNITSGGLYFYGWTACSDFEIQDPSPWPVGGATGNQLCGANNAQTWIGEQPGPHVTVGILDVYAYGGTVARLCVGPDTRVGFAEMCDGSEPAPLCNHVGAAGYGCFGINRLGYNPCDVVPVEQRSWGAVKSLYR